jgi:hypothetical protein
MILRTVLCSLGCLLRGHAPIVEINETQNKSELVCERCRAVLGDFVTNLRKNRVAPAQRAGHNGFQEMVLIGRKPTSAAHQRADRHERDIRESVWLDDGGRN